MAQTGAMGFVKATRVTELRTFLCPDGAEAKPEPVNQEVGVPVPSMVSASPSSQKGWAQAQASYFWEQIHKEVDGELEAKCSQWTGCCSSRSSPLAEG